MNTSQEFSEAINQAVGAEQVLSKQIDQSKERLETCITKGPFLEQAQVLLQTVAAETQNQLKLHLEEIVNTGLETCFPETYNAHVDFINKRGKIECDIYLHDGNGNRVDPLEDNGGGLADIVSFSLRMASWTIGHTDNVIILDEPFKFVDETIKPLAGELLQHLSKKLNLQLIFVTHDKEMVEVADRVFHVNKGGDDISKVTLLK